MPYVVDRRVSGSHKSTYNAPSVPNLPAGEVWNADSVTKYEVIYGYRTGQNALSKQLDLKQSEYNPPKGAGIAARLEYRKRFIENFEALQQSSFDEGNTSSYLMYDRGNEFASTKIQSTCTPNKIRDYAGFGIYRNFVNATAEKTFWMKPDGTLSTAAAPPQQDFLGYFATHKVPELSTDMNGLSRTQAVAQGTSAIQQMNPVQNHASVLTTLLELVSGDVPGLFKQLRKHIETITAIKGAAPRGIREAGSAVGGAYLENVFGLTPIFRDINAAIQVLTTMDSLLFPDDNTRRTFDRTISSRRGSFNTTMRASGYGLMNPAIGNSTGQFLNGVAKSGLAPSCLTSEAYPAECFATEIIDVRCVARFATGLRPNNANNGYLDQITNLLGLNLTPAVLWELVPWSWLLDWFYNIGTIVQNVTNLHMANIILNYAYATFRREAVSGVWQRPNVTPSGFTQSFTGALVTRHKVVQKVRLKSSPYGFGSALNSLTGTQWAILVALGLARAR